MLFANFHARTSLETWPNLTTACSSDRLLLHDHRSVNILPTLQAALNSACSMLPFQQHITTHKCQSDLCYYIWSRVLAELDRRCRGFTFAGILAFLQHINTVGCTKHKQGCVIAAPVAKVCLHSSQVGVFSWGILQTWRLAVLHNTGWLQVNNTKQS